MKLLARSMLRHLRGHVLQTIFTLAVTILITGMLAVLFHFASSFQNSLRTYALDKNGSYHYRYSTSPGTEAAKLLAQMAEEFQADDWFSEVTLTATEQETSLTLTVRHPGFFTTRTMNRKFDSLKKAHYHATNEVFYLGRDHNYELLAASGDLSRENGIYSFLLVFLLLFASISVAAVLTLGAIFRVSAMQRERETALLAGIGAKPGQLVGMLLMESAFYCLCALPAGYFLGILVYQGIEKQLDNIIYSLLGFPPVRLVISVPYSAALLVSALCVILLSGLKPALDASRISPIALLQRTREIVIRRPAKEKDNEQAASHVEHWLAKKSFQRFRRRNRPIRIMLAVTFALCFVLNGVWRYATEVIEMTFDTISYNFSVDLYGEEKEALNALAGQLVEASDRQLVMIKESLFCLHAPYPLSGFGESFLRTNQGMLPDVSLLCIDDARFRAICEELEIPADADGMWGIFLNTDRSWLSDGVMVKGKPFSLTAGDTLILYDSPDGSNGAQAFTNDTPDGSNDAQAFSNDSPDGSNDSLAISNDSPDGSNGAQAFALTIAGSYDRAPLYSEITGSTRVQLLVPEAVFSSLEPMRPYRNTEEGSFHVSLRGSLADSATFAENMKALLDTTTIIWHISDFNEALRQEKAGVDSFEFLCAALIGIFVLICICGNFTVSWAVNNSRKREFATLLSVGMTPGSLRNMRFLELLRHVLCAFAAGALTGSCAYWLIYRIYSSEYQIRWHFPLPGFALGIAALFFSVGVTDIALALGNRGSSLSEQLRAEE